MVNNNQLNKSYQYPKEDKEILERMRHPSYDGGTFALPPNATSLEKTKYEICCKIVRYKRENNLTLEKVAERIKLSSSETKRILLYRINEFTLDRLITYADNLFSPLEIGIIRAEPRERLKT